MHLGCPFGDLEHRQAGHLKFILCVTEVVFRWQVLCRLLRPLLFLLEHLIKSFVKLGEVWVGYKILVSLTLDEQFDLAS